MQEQDRGLRLISRRENEDAPGRSRTCDPQLRRLLVIKENQLVTNNNGPSSVHAQIHDDRRPIHQDNPIAKSILTLASAKQWIPEHLLLMLAQEVLADGRIQLALAIQEGGAEALQRAISLANLLVGDSKNQCVQEPIDPGLPMNEKTRGAP